VSLRSTVVALVAATVPALTPAAAGAVATVSTPKACYSSRALVDYVGVDFRPNAAYTAKIGATVVKRGRVSAFGDLSGDFRAPVPARAGPGERTFTLVVSDGTTTARTRFRSSIFGADFDPDQGSPDTLRTRFAVFGFGSGRDVYLHYLTPARRLKRTILLGRTSGPCGSLRSASRRLFPFPAGPGEWRFQFDTRRVYTRSAVPRVRLIIPIIRSRRT